LRVGTKRGEEKRTYLYQGFHLGGVWEGKKVLHREDAKDQREGGGGVARKNIRVNS